MATTTQTASTPATTTHRSVLTIAIYIVGIALIAFLFLFRLDQYPLTWFDEGAYINVARTFAETGVYAERDSDGFTFTGPVVSTGPTVIVPIALLFKVIEPSLFAARLVMVVYGFLTFAALYALVRMLIGSHWAAVLALALAMFAWGNQMPYLFRNVIGEGPAAFYIIAALWLWLRPGKRSIPMLVLVGVLIGLGSITKNQTALFALPALFVAWLLDLIYYKHHRGLRGWLYFVIPGVVSGIIFAGWTYFAFYLIGANMRDVVADLAGLRTAGANAYFVLDPTNKIQNIFTLFNGLTFGGLFLPALLYTIFLGLRRNEGEPTSTNSVANGQTWAIFTLFVLFSAVGYVLSIGWVRLFIPVRLLGLVCVVKLVYDLTNGLRFEWAALREALMNSLRGKSAVLTSAMLVSLFVMGWMVISIALPSTRAMYYVVRSGHNAAFLVADYLNANVATDVEIETWEKELSNMSDHNYHFPPQIMESHFNAFFQRMGPPVAGIYDFREHGTYEYVIVGEFGERAGVYTPDRLTDYEQVEKFGQYTIYRRKAAS